MLGMVDRIERGCQALGWSYADFARKAGLPHENYVSRIRSGQVNGRKYLAQMAAVLKCEVVWLTAGVGPTPVWWKPDAQEPSSTPAAPLDVEVLRLLLEQQRQLTVLRETLEALSRRLDSIEGTAGTGRGGAQGPTGGKRRSPRGA